MCACYSHSGHLVYARNGNLLAVPFSLDRLEVTGQPTTVLEGVLMSRNSGVANFDLSATGDLAVHPRTGRRRRADAALGRTQWPCRATAAASALLPASAPFPRRHPAGDRGRRLRSQCVRVHLRSGVLSNITTDGVSHWPVWSPDGQRIGYRSGPMGQFQLFEVPADRSGPAEQVLPPGISQSPGSYSPDGRAIVFTMNMNTAAPPKVAVVALEGDRYSAASRRFSLRAGFTEVLAQRPVSRVLLE